MKNGNVTLMVADLGASVEFYTKVLGLKLKASYGKYFAEVKTQGLTIGLHPMQKGKGDTGSQKGFSIGFAVEDIESAFASLKEKGIKFSPDRIVEDEPIRLAYFKDRDGYPLYIVQKQK